MREAKKAQVLIVEDDKEIRASLAELLSDDGYQVECADNGKTALDYLGKADDLPCMIFLDIMMPIMDGYSFRSEQVKDPRLASIPTVVISADGHNALKAKMMGLNEFLRKPIDIDDLLDVTAKHCVRHSFKPL